MAHGKQFLIVIGGKRTKSVVPLISPCYSFMQVVKGCLLSFDLMFMPVPSFKGRRSNVLI
jgi:hypothetical protein